ncbi:MAG: hypothetical protein H7210_05160, partial [Pyrinomonadaceae bacterium]|nr:hypothetical protein [Phycisphaerales bacterium]
ELSADMRQDQSLLLGSHNSYNSSAYGAAYPASQHSYTLSEQLDLGLRSLDLDVHGLGAFPNTLWLSHASCTGFGQLPGQLTLAQGLAEIRTWLNQNPGEVLTINVEQHFQVSYPSGLHTLLVNSFESLLGGGNPTFGPDILIRPNEIPLAANFTDGFSGSHRRAITLATMSLSDLRDLGRVLVVNTGGVSAPCNQNYWPDYPAQNIMLGDIVSFNWCGPDNWYTYTGDEFAGNANLGYWGTNPIGLQVRTGCTYPQPSIYSVLYNNTSGGEYEDYGSVSPIVIREAVRSGMDYIRFDPVGRSEGVPFQPIEFPADEQMRSTIWSWDHRYPPPVDSQPRAAMAVVQGDTARIRWADPAAEMRYAVQDRNGQWSISSARGNFDDAPPEVEESSTSANFRVPGNAFEMQNLFGEMVRAGITQVWINYHDLDGNGVWTHHTQNREFEHNVPDPAPSPLPYLVVNGLGLSGILNFWALSPAPPMGRVLGVLPGSYPGAFVFAGPGTIVPAEHAHPVAIGRP